MIQDHYCSQKFDWAEVRLYDGYVVSCCQADPHRITLDQISQHPVGFFNYQEIRTERRMMLDNQRVPGCHSCWKMEERGLESYRQKQRTTTRIYQDIDAVPQTVNLVISNTCNQTCIYCCKNFSNSWLTDVMRNGDYGLPGYALRYDIQTSDRIMMKLSQKDLHSTDMSRVIMDQIRSISHRIQTLHITGGEPFLDNHLVDIVDQLSDIPNLVISTGMAVKPQRFKELVARLHRYQNIHIIVSAENTGVLHEFNRYGSQYPTWLENFAVVKDHFPYSFYSVISNLTLFGLANFLDRYHDANVHLANLVDPGFLVANLLDDHSKKNIHNELSALARSDLQPALDLMMSDPDPDQKSMLRRFLSEFASRRGIDLAVLPKSFRQWLQIGTD